MGGHLRCHLASNLAEWFEHRSRAIGTLDLLIGNSCDTFVQEHMYFAKMGGRQMEIPHQSLLWDKPSHLFESWTGHFQDNIAATIDLLTGVNDLCSGSRIIIVGKACA